MLLLGPDAHSVVCAATCKLSSSPEQKWLSMWGSGRQARKNPEKCEAEGCWYFLGWGKTHNLLEKRIWALTHELVERAGGWPGGWVPLLLEAAVAHTATCFGFVIDLSTNRQSSGSNWAESLEMSVPIAAGVCARLFSLLFGFGKRGGGEEGGPWNQISVNFWQKGPILFFHFNSSSDELVFGHQPIYPRLDYLKPVLCGYFLYPDLFISYE